MYTTFPNLPPVPESLIEEFQTIIDKPCFVTEEGTVNYVRIKRMPESLKKWIMALFPNKIVRPYYQVIGHQFNDCIHCDLYSQNDPYIDKRARTHAYHYLLDSGGKKVETVFYHKKAGEQIRNPFIMYPEDLSKVEEVERICAPEKTWFRIPVDIFHSVGGIEEGKYRIAISFNVVGEPGAYNDIIV